MEIWVDLTKDPLFLAALVVLLTGLGVLAWCLRGLFRRSGAPRDLRPLRAAENAPAPAPQAPASGGLPHPVAPTPSAAPSVENDAAVLYSVLEERFTELSRRIASLEGGKTVAKTADANAAVNLSPLLKRLEEMQEEINKIKIFLANLPAPSSQGAADLAALSAKVDGLQKVLEHLALEPEVSKPS